MPNRSTTAFNLLVENICYSILIGQQMHRNKTENQLYSTYRATKLNSWLM